MKRQRTGFTIVELVIVLLMGSILTSIALYSFGNSAARYSVRGARNSFVTLHARARASAIERGTTTTLLIDLAGDSAAIIRGDTVVERIHFDDQFDVDLQGSSTILELCMSPRGYADDGCTSFSTAQSVSFASTNGSDAESVEILPLGQLIY